MERLVRISFPASSSRVLVTPESLQDIPAYAGRCTSFSTLVMDAYLEIYPASSIEAVRIADQPTKTASPNQTDSESDFAATFK